MPPQTSADHWRRLRRGPAWITFVPTGFMILGGIPRLYVNARDGHTDTAHTTIWLTALAVLLAATATGVWLRSREWRMGGQMFVSLAATWPRIPGWMFARTGATLSITAWA